MPAAIRCDPTTLEELTAAPRRGAMLVLMVFSIVLFLITAAFSVDVAYMQLVRTELGAATDAAAKAATAALSREQDDQTAVQAALDLAAANAVGGRPLILSASNVEFGRALRKPDGSWKFQPGDPHNAVRVTSRMSDLETTGSVPLFFGSLFGFSSFSPERVSTAAFFHQEICLVIDRSHSMCFDLTGIEWSYPSGTPTYPNEVCYPPHDALSRWAAVEASIDEFLEIVQGVSPRPRVALVTWASTMDKSTFEYRLTRTTSPASLVEVPLGNLTVEEFSQAVHSRGDQVMIGGTNMSAGLQAGIDVLTSDQVRPTAQRSLVLMSDGRWNLGEDPVTTAQAAAQSGIVIHTISFLDGTDQSTMEEIADITGGRHYYASDADALRSAFEDLAHILPATITD